MVNNLSLSFILITFFISVFIPFIWFLKIKKKFKASTSYFIVGIIIFVIFQMLIRIPLLQKLYGQSWFVINIMSNKLYFSLFLGLTAALVEEFGRLIAFKLILSSNRSWENGVAYGLGHGGVESFIFVGITYFFNILVTLNINYGWFQTIINRLPRLFGSIEASKELLISTSSYMFLIAGLERLFVIFIQIALSLLVINAVRKCKYSLFFYAILIHTLLDFVAVYISNIIIVEIVVCVVGIFSLIYINKVKERWKFII